MDSDLLNTDGPMTRGRRRAMCKTGLTPVAGAAGPGGTPNLLQDTPMARELFTDKTNILDKARSFPGQGKDVSPTNGWASKASGGVALRCLFASARTMQMKDTPPLVEQTDFGNSASVQHCESFDDMQKPDLQNVTPSSSACVHGPTPANTPAAGCVVETMPAPSLLSQAVNVMKQEDSTQHVFDLAKPSEIDDIQEHFDKQAMHAGTNENEDACDGETEQAEKAQCMDDIDPAISEILKELDEYVLDSPEAQNEDRHIDQTAEDAGDEPVESVDDDTEMDAATAAKVAGTPAAVADNAILPQSAASSVMAEPPSTSKMTPGQGACTDEAVCDDTAVQSVGVVRDDETRHNVVEELPISAGPYNREQAAEDESSEDIVQHASPALPVVIAAAGPQIAIADEQSPIQLQAAGREDDLPTPGFFQPGASFMSQVVGSPATPEDASIKPLSFAKSAGSQFATPEIPISCGMTPMTTMEERQAQKHIPAWNRISKVVEKQYPLVAKIVQGLWGAPSEQPAWAKTPFMLLHAVCVAKGWGLTVSPETEARIGAGSSIVATVNMPSPTLEGGRTFTATGKNMGNLEALLLAAAGVLERLLKEHLITGKDATAAMNAAPSTLKSGSVPAMVGSTLHFGHGQAAGMSSFAAARAKFSSGTQQQWRPPVPAPRSARAGMLVPNADVGTPMESSPHVGIGVRAPVQMGATPELLPVASPAGSLIASAKNSSKPVTPVYHPPMRTGTSSVRSKNKATIAAAAKPTGLKALQEQQKELMKNMKKESDIMAELTKSVGKISLATKSSTPLRGLPVPKGSCIVFDDDGQASQVEQRDQLRGVPLSRGQHTYFE